MYIEGGVVGISVDVFRRGLCLLSDNKMVADRRGSNGAD